MKSVFVKGLLLAIAAVLLMGVAGVQKKILVEVSTLPETDSCNLNGNDIVNRTAAPINVIDAGALAASDCAYVSGLTFTNAYESVRLGKVVKDCDKKINMHTNFAVSAGKAGMLECWTYQSSCNSGGLRLQQYSTWYGRTDACP